MEIKDLKSSSQTPLRTDAASTVNQYEGRLLSAFCMPKVWLVFGFGRHLQAQVLASPWMERKARLCSPADVLSRKFHPYKLLNIRIRRHGLQEDFCYLGKGHVVKSNGETWLCYSRTELYAHVAKFSLVPPHPFMFATANPHKSMFLRRGKSRSRILIALMLTAWPMIFLFALCRWMGQGDQSQQSQTVSSSHLSN